MNRSPWMPFYVDDFIASTTDMSCDEVGAYTRLLCHLWSRGPLPMDDKVICRIAACRLAVWRSIRTRFSPVTRDDGTPGLSQTRLEAERFRRQTLMNERAEAGRRGAASRWNSKANGKAIGKSKAFHNHNQNSNTSNVVITRSESEAAPTPPAVGLPRIASIEDADDATSRNRAAIRAWRTK